MLKASCHRPHALILCGGLGERMQPWTEKRPKPLFGLGDGVETLFSRHLRELAKFGVREPIHVNVLENWAVAFHDEAKRAGVRVKLWPENGPPNGSATSLGRVAKMMGREDGIVVIYGDVWFDDAWYETVTQAVRAARATWLGVSRTPENEPARGALRLDVHDGDKGPTGASILEIDEDAKRATGWMHAGISVWLARDAARGRGDIARDLVPRVLRDGGHVLAFSPTRGAEFLDCGYAGRYGLLVCREYLSAAQARGAGRVPAAAVESILRAQRILTAGNGGSLSVAEHAAQDWSKLGRRDAAAIAEPSFLTAFANDHGYERALVLVAERRGIGPGTCVVGYSVSGTSQNVMNLLASAERAGSSAVLVTSADASSRGGLEVRAPWPRARVQECEDWFAAWSHGITRAMCGLAPWCEWWDYR